MFYKALALWLPLELGFDVLFQDADLVWFRDPLPFLMGDLTNDHLRRFGSRPHGFFSDDGQRSVSPITTVTIMCLPYCCCLSCAIAAVCSVLRQLRFLLLVS